MLSENAKYCLAFAGGVLVCYILRRPLLTRMRVNSVRPRSKASSTASEATQNPAFTEAHYDEEWKFICVMRNDLNLGKGKMAAQCAHAAVECALQLADTDERGYEQWSENGCTKIVVRANEARELNEAAKQARALGLCTYLVHDAGRTQIPAGTATCVGVGPGPRSLVDKVCSQFKLM